MEDKLGQTLALPPGALGLAGSPRCRRLDYGELAFPDALFDGAYTMETLARAFDHRRALRELRLRGRAVGHAQPARRRRPAAAGPGGRAQLHGPGRGLPPPRGLALQRGPGPPAREVSG
jgi:hypothetical protein